MPLVVSHFPAAADVFTDPELMQRVLAPVAIIELPGAGRLPLVVPFEPLAGRWGERTRDVHTVFASPDRIGFRLTPDGRLDLLGDARFFELIHRADSEHRSRSLTAFYEDQYAGLTEARTHDLPEEAIEQVDPDLDWLDDEPQEEAMPDGTAFTRLLTLSPGAVLPRSTGEVTLWFEPASSTVLLTRAD